MFLNKFRNVLASGEATFAFSSAINASWGFNGETFATLFPCLQARLVHDFAAISRIWWGFLALCEQVILEQVEY